jgi:hypothetical protein
MRSFWVNKTSNQNIEWFTITGALSYYLQHNLRRMTLCSKNVVNVETIMKLVSIQETVYKRKVMKDTSFSLIPLIVTF